MLPPITHMPTTALTFSGWGSLYHADRWLATVSYSICTWLTTAALVPGTVSEDPGRPDVDSLGAVSLDHAYGMLRATPDAPHFPLGPACALELEDGRRCHVTLTLIGDPAVDNYIVQFVDLAELG